MLIKNGNPKYGHAGPYKAKSADALIKDMEQSFLFWAKENKRKTKDLGYIEWRVNHLQEDFRKTLSVVIFIEETVQSEDKEIVVSRKELLFPLKEYEDMVKNNNFSKLLQDPQPDQERI